MMYFKLVTIIAEVFPEKLIALPENLLKTLLASVEMGLTDYGSDVTRQCLEMLDSVASYVFQNPNTHSMAYEAMAHFLEVCSIENFSLETICSCLQVFHQPVNTPLHCTCH